MFPPRAQELKPRIIRRTPHRDRLPRSDWQDLKDPSARTGRAGRGTLGGKGRGGSSCPTPLKSPFASQCPGYVGQALAPQDRRHNGPFRAQLGATDDQSMSSTKRPQQAGSHGDLVKGAKWRAGCLLVRSHSGSTPWASGHLLQQLAVPL